MSKNDLSSLPNILIFLPDEMRGDSLSLEKKRNPIISTPNVDALANDGVAFSNCFTVNPVCVPSRCCTFTGQYVHSCGHRSLFQLLEPHEENLFRLLKNQDYEVVWVGRNDMLSEKALKNSVSKRIPLKLPDFGEKGLLEKIKINPYSEGHPLWKSFYFGERTAEQAKDADFYAINSALEYLDSKPKKPFCLYIALSFPHPPYTVEEPYFSKYERDKIPKPIPAKLEDKPEFMRIMHDRYGLNKLTESDFKEIMAVYYGMVTKVDHQFGQVIDKLKNIGEYDRTAIFFFSDHGDYAGNYGLVEKWPNAFQDCLINVPLVCKLPEIKPTKKLYDNLLETIDIFPTILEIAHIKTPYTHFGKSLIPLLNGIVKEHRNAVFSEGGYNPRESQCFEPPIKDPNIPLFGIYYEKTNIPVQKPTTVARSAMIRTREWKLVIRDGVKGELYDMLYDPIEANNLFDVSVYERVKIELKEKMLKWYLSSSDNPNWKKHRVP